MIARRVGLTPTPASSAGVGVDRAGDQPEGGGRRISGHDLVQRLHGPAAGSRLTDTCPSLDCSLSTAIPRARSIRSV